MRVDFRSIAVGLLTIGVLSRGAAGQSVLDRTPNLSGGWVGPTGTLQFNFLHRFSVGASPTRKVSNSPTFLPSYRLPVSLLVGFNYSTSSDVAPQFPNEWEAFGRAVPLGVDRGSPVELALQLGYNQAARSADGELTLSRRTGPLRLMSVGRFLSHGFNRDTMRFAVGGGATLRLRSEEHTSELQSQSNLVCRLLLEKKKHNATTTTRDRITRVRNITDLECRFPTNINNTYNIIIGIKHITSTATGGTSSTASQHLRH